MIPASDKREQIATDVREMEALTSALLERERIKNRTARPGHAEVVLGAMSHTVLDGFAGRAPSVVLAESPDVLNIQADEGIVFEDSPNGVLAAAAAGIACVVIPNPLTSQLKFKKASLQLASLAELSLSEGIEKLNN